eukprot:scaffold81933_cov28-Tisochrysis_lutea.AAC.4
MGRLMGQRVAHVVFATPPGDVVLEGADGRPALNICSSFNPNSCGLDRYSTEDVFFLEVCLFNEICTNAHDLFAQPEGGYFRCELDVNGLERVREALVNANGPR